MCQPPNSTIFPPSARCAACSGVFLSDSTEAESDIAGNGCSPRDGSVSIHATRHACVSEGVSYAPRMSDDSSPGAPNPRDAHPHRVDSYRPVAPVTMLLIAICVAIAILSLLTGGSWTHWLYISENPFVPWLSSPLQAAAYGARPAFLPEVWRGQVWRLFTPALMHAPIIGFGVLHIVFNMYWLRAFGTEIETRLRSRTFFGLVLLIGV